MPGWGRGTLLLRPDAVCGGGVRERTTLLAQLSAALQSLPPLPTTKLGPSGADLQVGGFVYILTGGALGIHQGWQPTLLCCGAVCGGGV